MRGETTEYLVEYLWRSGDGKPPQWGPDDDLGPTPSLSQAKDAVHRARKQLADQRELVRPYMDVRMRVREVTDWCNILED